MSDASRASKNQPSRSASLPALPSAASLDTAAASPLPAPSSMMSPELAALRAAERQRQRQRMDELSRPRDHDRDDASSNGTGSSFAQLLRNEGASPIPQKPA